LAGLALTGCLLAGAPLAARAETSYGQSGWQVIFTEDKKMKSNFKNSDISDTAYNLQPGDNAMISLALKNQNRTATDWYMKNTVLSSLEDYAESASGGAYTYVLTYTDSQGSVNTLYSSEAVGGENVTGGEGLHGVGSSMANYFYLDTLRKGESGKISLKVALDGETQGNAYQDTLADLRMQFAVELNDNPPPTYIQGSQTTQEPEQRTETVVRQAVEAPRTGEPAYTSAAHTGDGTEMLPYVAVSAVSGCVLLLFAVSGMRRRKREKEETV